jgi:hypothetical protein
METTDIQLDRVALFKQSINKMIASNEDSYKSSYGWGKTNTTRIREYTDDEIASIIASGDIDSMRELSRSYYYSSGYYRRIILYYAYLLTYSFLVVPHYKKKVSNQGKANYYQALDFCDSIHIKSFSQHIATRTLVDGCYYGIIVEKNGLYSTMDLPFSYCRTRFKGYSGLDIVELNLNYFTTISDRDMRDRAFKAYPKEVKRAYNKYTNGTNKKLSDQWYIFDEGVGIYFKMDEARPMFINTIPAIETFQTYRDLELKKQELETKRILVQQLGTNKDGEFIIEPEEAAELHSGAVRMLSKNTDMDVLTTYAEVDVKSLSDARQTVTSNLQTFGNFIYNESGASANIFNANGNLSLDQSLKNDLSLMMSLADKLSAFYTYIVNQNVAIANVTYSVVILPISHYNTKEYIENTYKLASAGYSFLLPALASGLTQKDTVDVKILENELLELEKLFTPLRLGSTQSGDGGAPAKSNENKSDKTIKNQNGGSE